MNKHDGDNILHDDFIGTRSGKGRAWRLIRPFVVILLSLALALFCVWFGIDYLLDEYINPVDVNDATPIVVVVDKGDGASDVAKTLYEACGEGKEGLISNKAVFKIYCDFAGKANKLKAGTYILSKNMDIPQMVEEICKGNPPKASVKFTIKEGQTVEDIARVLSQEGLLKDPDDFFELCRNAEGFEYDFIKDIPVNPDEKRSFKLEGYLFPDTYMVFEDANARTIINKMLLRFFEIFTDEYIMRAQELGLSIDDVVSLASMIEREAKTADFKKVSAVFHNRLKRGEPLGSDAPLQYIYKTNTLLFTEEQINNPSLYNTRIHPGLPLGPISNPGKTAIEAALYPDEEFIKQEYLYFCLKDTETGELAFAKTLEEHNENVAQYSPGWR
ncbi:MAG: putative aminodeoxychorismate lyase [Firmicutes bacterium ADurb.Bin182]|nr:MAG: putative aminodeoxychorismate lyase [Firmicutes bacterium ADurb.Bin182]